MTEPAPKNQPVVASSDATQQMRFLGMVSHELRTPLHAILGFSEMIEQQIFGKVGAPEYLEFAREIRASGQKLLTQVNELIIASGAWISEANTVDAHLDLTHLTGEAIQVAKPVIGHKNQTIGLAANAAQVGLWADDRTIRHMLAALIDNASKFSPSGAHIALGVAIDDAQNVMLTVADEGPGFPPDAMQDLTAAFRQADDSLARHHEGMGIGLFTCNRLMKMMDGRLELANCPEGGAKVSLIFPANRMIELAAEDDLTVMDDDDEPAFKAAILVLEHGGQTYHAFQNDQAFLLGRNDPSAARSGIQLKVDDKRASRSHAQIIASDGVFFLVDESRRGSYVAIDGAEPEFVHLTVSSPLVGSGVIALGDLPDADGVATIHYRLRQGGGE